MADEHYSQLQNRSFYEKMIKYITSGPLVPMVWEGKNVVEITRKLLGKAEPELSLPGTIRSDFSADVLHNVIHGSHSNEAAKKEIGIWFHHDEIIPWTSDDERWTFI